MTESRTVRTEFPPPQPVRCPGCSEPTPRRLAHRTALGYHRYRCDRCGTTCNQRTGTRHNRLELPTDLVFWAIRLHRDHGASLREVAGALGQRGIETTYEAVRDWAQRFGDEVVPATASQAWFACVVPTRIRGRAGALHRLVDRAGHLIELELSPEPRLREFRARVWPTGQKTRLRPARPHRALPRPTGEGPFLGRSAEISRLDELAAAGVRLITLVGAPGVGKSRLALRAAEREPASVFVPLAATHSPSAMLAAVAAAIDLQVPGRSGAEQVAARIGRVLRARGVRLLVLDNLEQLLPGAARTVDALLDHCPEVRFLVTSRHAIGRRREVRLEMAPLADDDAIALFELREGRTTPRQGAEREELRSLVHRLDNLPLSIELAASMRPRLPVREILSRVREHGEIGDPALLEAGGRHSSLRAALDWSWERIGGEERATLALCSVFPAPFTVEAAAAVLDEPVDRAHSRLVQLRECSLVYSTRDATSGQLRYGLLETIRDYASARLRQRHETSEIERRHAAYYAREGWRARRAYAGEGDKALGWLEMEHAHLLAGFQRCATSFPEIGTRCLLALEPVAIARGLETYLDDLDQAMPGAEPYPDLFFDALRARASVRFHRGATPLALEDCERARALSPRTTDPQGNSLWADVDSIRCLEASGGASLAATRLAEGLRQAQGLRRPELIARYQEELGVAHANAAEWERAVVHLEEALRGYRALGYRRLEGTTLGNLGLTHIGLRNYTLARELCSEALQIHREVGNRTFEGIEHNRLGDLALELGDLALARRHYEMADSIHAQIGGLKWLGITRMCRGALEHASGDTDAARAALMAAKDCLAEADYVRGNAFVHAHLCALAASAGDLDEAERLLDEARSNAGRSRDPRVSVLVEIAEGFLELGACRRHLARQRSAEAVKELFGLLQRIRQRAERDTSIDFDSKLLLERLTHLMADELSVEPGALAGISGILVVDGGLAWLERRQLDARLEARLELDRSLRQRALLGCLLDQRRAGAPPVTTDRLFEVGWPGERARHDSRANRVRVALSRIRTAGLREVILNSRDGYELNPTLAVLRTPIDEGTSSR